MTYKIHLNFGFKNGSLTRYNLLFYTFLFSVLPTAASTVSGSSTTKGSSSEGNTEMSSSTNVENLTSNPTDKALTDERKTG